MADESRYVALIGARRAEGGRASVTVAQRLRGGRLAQAGPRDPPSQPRSLPRCPQLWQGRAAGQGPTSATGRPPPAISTVSPCSTRRRSSLALSQFAYTDRDHLPRVAQASAPARSRPPQRDLHGRRRLAVVASARRS